MVHFFRMLLLNWAERLAGWRHCGSVPELTPLSWSTDSVLSGSPVQEATCWNSDFYWVQKKKNGECGSCLSNMEQYWSQLLWRGPGWLASLIGLPLISLSLENELVKYYSWESSSSHTPAAKKRISYHCCFCFHHVASVAFVCQVSNWNNSLTAFSRVSLFSTITITPH